MDEGSPNFEKGKFDGFMALANFRLKRWELRGTVEWRTSLAIWATLISATALLKVRPPEIIMLTATFLLITGHGIVWLSQACLRQAQDIQTAFYYVDHCERLLGLATVPRQKPKLLEQMTARERWWGNIAGHLWHNGFQAWTTIVLALVFYFLTGRIGH